MAGAGARGMLGEAFGMTPDHPDFPAWREEFFVNYESRMTERTTTIISTPTAMPSTEMTVITETKERFGRR